MSVFRRIAGAEHSGLYGCSGGTIDLGVLSFGKEERKNGRFWRLRYTSQCRIYMYPCGQREIIAPIHRQSLATSCRRTDLVNVDWVVCTLLWEKHDALLLLRFISRAKTKSEEHAGFIS
jgi:hypothetical protein